MRSLSENEIRLVAGGHVNDASEGMLNEDTQRAMDVITVIGYRQDPNGPGQLISFSFPSDGNLRRDCPFNMCGGNYSMNVEGEAEFTDYVDADLDGIPDMLELAEFTPADGE